MIDSIPLTEVENVISTEQRIAKDWRTPKQTEGDELSGKWAPTQPERSPSRKSTMLMLPPATSAGEFIKIELEA